MNFESLYQQIALPMLQLEYGETIQLDGTPTIAIVEVEQPAPESGRHIGTEQRCTVHLPESATITKRTVLTIRDVSWTVRHISPVEDGLRTVYAVRQLDEYLSNDSIVM